MIVGAIGDAHGGKYLTETMVRGVKGADLLLLAGDIADSNDIESFAAVHRLIRREYDGPIVAVFGNDEYQQDRQKYRDRFDIVFLDDEATEIEVEGTKVRIVGSTGSLDRPTWWQRTHVPQIWKTYAERIDKIKALLVRDGSDLLVYMSHYAPTYLTLEGERIKAFPEMGSRAMERVLLEQRPDLVIHAHAHNGSRRAVLKKEQTSLDDAGRTEVPVWNVSLPLTKEVTRLELTREGGWDARLQR